MSLSNVPSQSNGNAFEQPTKKIAFSLSVYCLKIKLDLCLGNMSRITPIYSYQDSKDKDDYLT